MKRAPWPVLAVCAVLTAGVTLLPDRASALPPVYLTIISHNEEPGAGRPDYTADLNYYLQNRALVKLLAETITSRGATFNFQSDWNYLEAVAMYDVGSVTGDTGGKNIVRWMREDLGMEVDPHAHETQYNYADVAYLIEQLSVTPSKNVGGFLYDPPPQPGQGWERHINGINGWVYPSYFWRADNLWGAATYLHQGNNDKSSGIWRPQDGSNFYVDAPSQRLQYIGGCNGQVGLQELLNDMETGAAPAGGFYTANLMMIQDFMTAQSIAQLGSFIDSLAPYVAQGRLRWVTLTEMADLWRTQYGSQPFRYDCAATAPTPTPTPTPVPGAYAIEAIETWVSAPNGNQLYTRIAQPMPAQYPGQRFPALIAIPGGTGSGAPFADSLLYRNLAATGFVVVVFNPEGRGSGLPGNLTSQGTEDCNGFVHQDDLKAVVEYAAGLSQGHVKVPKCGVWHERWREQWLRDAKFGRETVWLGSGGELALVNGSCSGDVILGRMTLSESRASLIGTARRRVRTSPGG